MCLLTFAPAGATINDDRLHEASINNPDGFGFAIRTDKTIVRARGMNFHQVLAEYHKALRTYGHGDSMFHLRLATHGTTNKSNCHPFYIGADRDSMLGHNGIIPIQMPKGDVRSDTRYFSEVVMPKDGGVSMLDRPEYMKHLEQAIGNSKLVILTNNELASSNFYIVNEHMGHWDSDVWWSNHSYNPYTMSTWKSPYKFDDCDDDVDSWSWTTECPLCAVHIIVNEYKEETMCPTCKICLLCENHANSCNCYFDYDDSDDDDYTNIDRKLDSQATLVPYGACEYF